MKKAATFLAVFSLILVAAPVSASDRGNKDDANSERNTSGKHEEQKGLHLNFEKQLTPAACHAAGKPVINVREKVLNDVDSGISGNYWAYDTVTRTIKAWNLGDGTFCVTVNYEDSKFNAIAGQRSPGDTGVLSGKEKGEFEGGYRGIVTGTLLSDPAWPTKGSVGTVDYRCDVNGTCPGYVSWMGQYFASGYGFEYGFWGWVYHGGKYGTWINADSGNSGDII